MALSLSERLSRICRAFYARFKDAPDQRVYYWVREVFGDDADEGAHLIVTRESQETAHFRVGYTVSEDEGDFDVAFVEPEEWVRVEQVWTDVERAAAEAEKRDLLGESRDNDTHAEASEPSEREASPEPEQRTEQSTGQRAAQPRRANVPAIGETHRRSLDVEVTTNEAGTRSTFQFMTGGIARDGMIIEPDGGDVAAYLRNPVVLWQHGRDLSRGALPIAKSLSVERTDDGWASEVDWHSDDFSQAIAGMVRDGFLSAVSVGWRTLDAGWEERDGREVYVIRRWELTEFSVVAVPSDADALVMQRALNEAQLLDKIERLQRRLDEVEQSSGSGTQAGSRSDTAQAAPPPPPADEPEQAGTDELVTENEESAPRFHVLSIEDIKKARATRRANAQRLALEGLGRA